MQIFKRKMVCDIGMDSLVKEGSVFVSRKVVTILNVTLED